MWFNNNASIRNFSIRLKKSTGRWSNGYS